MPKKSGFNSPRILLAKWGQMLAPKDRGAAPKSGAKSGEEVTKVLVHSETLPEVTGIPVKKGEKATKDTQEGSSGVKSSISGSGIGVSGTGKGVCGSGIPAKTSQKYTHEVKAEDNTGEKSRISGIPVKLTGTGTGIPVRTTGNTNKTNKDLQNLLKKSTLSSDKILKSDTKHYGTKAIQYGTKKSTDTNKLLDGGYLRSTFDKIPGSPGFRRAFTGGLVAQRAKLFENKIAQSREICENMIGSKYTSHRKTEEQKKEEKVR